MLEAHTTELYRERSSKPKSCSKLAMMHGARKHVTRGHFRPSRPSDRSRPIDPFWSSMPWPYGFRPAALGQLLKPERRLSTWYRGLDPVSAGPMEMHGRGPHQKHLKGTVISSMFLPDHLCSRLTIGSDRSANVAAGRHGILVG